MGITVPPGASGASSALPGDQATIEIDPALEAGDEDADSAVGAGSTLSSTTSLSESVLEYRRLHGRTYQSTRTTEYWAPNDDQQNDGLDLIHHGVLILMNNELFLAPIGDNPQRVLDVGTGTGIWAIDFGDQFPGSEVIGTDISPIQPSWVPANVKFVIDDVLLDWTWPADHFDFIHLRALYGVIPDWEALYRKAYKHLKPGAWLEDLEMSVRIESDHVKLGPDHIFNRFADLTQRAGEKIGRSFSIVDGHTMKEHMEAAGFVDVAEHKLKAPMHAWPKDPKLREAGVFLQEAFDQSIEGLSTFLFTQVLGLSIEEVVALAAEMRTEARKRSNFHWARATIIYGREPEEPVETPVATAS